MESELCWFVAHTRPRCEKKLTLQCAREGLEYSLPLVRSVKRYRGKRLEFSKPLFSGYVFVRLRPGAAARMRRSDLVANLLEPPDQAEFSAQLSDILRALSEDLEVRLAPEVTTGQHVRIRSGPLRGLEGIVTERLGQMEVVLRLDFIGQAAAVKVSADELEPA